MRAIFMGELSIFIGSEYGASLVFGDAFSFVVFYAMAIYGSVVSDGSFVV
jgi:hypothetical protein